MISYLDIMMLLLTLFVLLFAYMQVAPAVTAQPSAPTLATLSGAPVPAVALAVDPAPAPQRVERAAAPLPVPETTAPTNERKVAEATATPAVSADEQAPAARPPEPPAPHAESSAAAGLAQAAESPPLDPTVRSAVVVPADEPVTRLAPAAEAEHGAESTLQGAPVAATAAHDTAPHAAALAAEAARARLLEAIRASALGERVEVASYQGSVNLEISDDILFDRGSASLKSVGQDLLDKVAVLVSQQDCTVSVEGHTDDVPIRNSRFASNWELSATRATNVTRFLIAHAVDSRRVRAVGYADTRPRADNGTAQGRARNRRVSLVLHIAVEAGSSHPVP